MNSETRQIQNPIFICGCHRTGTTLLQTMLSAHSSIDILPETKLYAWQWQPFKSVASISTQKKIDELATLMPFVNRAWALPENKSRLAGLKNSTRNHGKFSTVGDLMNHVMVHSTDSKSRPGEKSPLHIYHVDDILKRFPDARILITKRDLRGTFYSQSMRSRRKKLSHRSFRLFNLVASWTIAINLADLYLRKYGPDRVRIVQFESLVNEPDEEVASICEFLGMPYEAEMTKVDFENSSFVEVANKQGVDSATAERWRSELDASIGQRLAYLGNRELKVAGYSADNAKATLADRVTKTVIQAVNAVAMKNPQLVCYLGRDSRYRNLKKQFDACKLGSPYGPKLFVLGNHKSGTTAIAKLLATMCGQTATIDFPRIIRRDGYALARGELSFEDLVNRHPALFCTDIVKIPALTFVAPEIVRRFPESKILFIVRDPRDNIRSILNRRKIPGDRNQLPVLKKLLMRIQNRPSMDADIWGSGDGGYVGVLARRWNLAIDALNKLGAIPFVLKYEDFLAEKQPTLDLLANQFGFGIDRDVSAILDMQFQPAGNSNVDWREFFGSNLATIDGLCKERMVDFNYSPYRTK